MNQQTKAAFDAMTEALDACIGGALEQQGNPLGDERRAQVRELARLLCHCAPDDHPRVLALEEALGLKGQRPLSLVSFDLPSVHSWVADTAVPAVMRGGSLGLDRANRAVRDEVTSAGIHPGSVIFSGGGQGTLLVGGHQVEQAKQLIRKVFAQRLSGEARPVVAALPVSCAEIAVGVSAEAPRAARAFLGGDRGEAAGFGDLRPLLGAEVARERQVVGENLDAVLSERCAFCGDRPAAHAVRRGPGPEERICAVCNERRERARGGGGTGRSPDEEWNFAEIARCSKKLIQRDGYLAVVYADGRSVGGVLETLRTPLQFACFSRALDEAARGVESIIDALGFEGAEGQAKYLRLLAGGDDVLVVLPAAHAFEFALQLCRHVEAAMTAVAEQSGIFGEPGDPLFEAVSGLGMGVGVLYCSRSFPIRLAVNQAEALMRGSKARGAAEPAVRSTVDFRVITGNTLLDPRQWRDQMIVDEEGRPWTGSSTARRRRTLRPLSLDEAERLKEECRILVEQVPRTQRYALRQVATLAPYELELHLQYQMSRDSRWRAFLRRIWEVHRAGDEFNLGKALQLCTWREDTHGGGPHGATMTPVLDWLELSPCISSTPAVDSKEARS